MSLFQLCSIVNSLTLFPLMCFCRMSAIDFYCSVDKVKGVDGKDRVLLTFDGKYLPHTEQVSWRQFCRLKER